MGGALTIEASPGRYRWRGVRLVRQHHDADCAVAALAMLAGCRYEDAYLQLLASGGQEIDWQGVRPGAFLSGLEALTGQAWRSRITRPFGRLEDWRDWPTGAVGVFAQVDYGAPRELHALVVEDGWVYDPDPDFGGPRLMEDAPARNYRLVRIFAPTGRAPAWLVARRPRGAAAGSSATSVSTSSRSRRPMPIEGRPDGIG